MSGCLGDLELDAYVRSGAAEDRGRWREHLAACETCRRLVAAYALASTPDESPEHGELADDSSGLAEILAGEERYQPTAEPPLGVGGRGVVHGAFDRELERPVAIKVVWEAGLDATRRERLLAEARALALVAHPNIVALYDVHPWRDALVLIMERVKGANLRVWLAAQPRSTRVIAGVFAQAARGLAAAHAAGLAHCDVKPENILVGDDGRVRLSDFGLARHLASIDRLGEAPVTGTEMAAPSDAAPASATLLAGTPAYLAPERLRGEPPSPASDQFSFMVALHEALHGQRPFAGDSIEELTDAILADRRSPPRAAIRPRRLARLVARGLAAEPSARVGGMEVVAAELERVAAPARRVAAVTAVVALIAIALAGSIWWWRDPGPACAAPALAIDDVWTPAAQARLAARFAPGTEGGVPAFESVRGALSAHAERWRAAAATCPAASAGSGWASCLARSAVHTRALIDLLASPGSDGARAPFAVHALPDPRECGGAEETGRALGSASADAIEAVLRGRAECDLGAFAACAESAERVAASPAGDHPGLRGEALLLAAEARGMLDQPDAAERHLLAAADAAARARDDDLAARAFVALLYSTTKTHPRQATQSLALAEAAVVRAGNSPRLQAGLLVARADLESRLDQDAQAIEHLRRAIALREEEVGSGDLDLATPLGNLANNLARLGRVAEAHEAAARSLAILERHLPETHLAIARTAQNLAAMDIQLGRWDEAEAGFRRAADVRARVLGAQHPKVADTLDGLAETLRLRGRPDEGLAVARRALAIREAALPADHVDRAISQNNLGLFLIDAGRCGEALPLLESAVSGFKRADSSVEWLAQAMANQSHCLCQTGQADSIRAGQGIANEILGRVRATYGASHLLAADALIEIGLCESAAGQPRGAEKALAEALAIRIAADARADLVAEARWFWARAAWALGRRQAARAAAEEARAVLAETAPDDAAEIARWLRDPAARGQ